MFQTHRQSVAAAPQPRPQQCPQSVTQVLQKCFQIVLEVFQWCFKGGGKVFQKRSKRVLKESPTVSPKCPTSFPNALEKRSKVF